MAPNVTLQILPGSQFSQKAMLALNYKGVNYDLEVVQPTKLKKVLPPPYKVPVMRYNGEVIPDSNKILHYVDERHHVEDRPLYPNVDQNVQTEFESVEALEMWAHDILSTMYNVLAAGTELGKEEVLIPFVRLILPKPLLLLCGCLPGLAANSFSKKIRTDAIPLVGEKVLSSEEAMSSYLAECTQKLERCFKTDEQRYVLGTPTPTAADFAVFAPLKRLAHPIPELGIGPGYPDVFREGAPVPRLRRYFDMMNKEFYEGHIKYPSF